MPVPGFRFGRISLIEAIVGAVAFTAMLLVLISAGVLD